MVGPAGRRPVRDRLDARVDELFTTAIEHQVAEQRNLNRLLDELDRSLASVRGRLDELQNQVGRDLAPMAARLTTLEQSVRTSREATAQQLAGLRAEVEEALDGLRQEQAGRDAGSNARLDAEVERLVSGLDRRSEVQRSTLERLEAHVSGTNEDLGAELRRLHTDVTNELAEVETLAGALTRTRRLETEAREELAKDMTASVLAGLDETVATIRRQVQHSFGELQQNLNQGLAAVEAALEEARSVGRRVADLERSLVAYVETWGDRVTQERRELVQETIERFASGSLQAGTQAAHDRSRTASSNRADPHRGTRHAGGARSARGRAGGPQTEGGAGATGGVARPADP